MKGSCNFDRLINPRIYLLFVISGVGPSGRHKTPGVLENFVDSMIPNLRYLRALALNGRSRPTISCNTRNCREFADSYG